MPTTTIRYVNTASPAGGNGTTNATGSGDANRAYASFQTALDTEYGVTPNLVTSDIILKIICEGTAADPGGWGYYLPNFTTDSTRYIWLYVDPSKRWKNKYDTTKYRWENNSSIYMILDGGTSIRKIVFEGIQWKHTTFSNVYSVISFYHQNMTAATVLEFRDCMMYNVGIGGAAGKTFLYAAGVTDKSVTMVNCVFAGKWSEIVSYPYANNGTFILYNNTISGSSNHVGWFGNAYATVAFKNNIFVGTNPNGYIVQTGTADQQRIWNTKNNITNINEGPEIELRNQTIRFIDPTNGDLRIHPDSYPLIRWKGMNLTNDPLYPFSTDANNNSRNNSTASNGWDIGAFQEAPTESIAVTTPFKKVYQYIGATDNYIDKRVDAAISGSNYLIDGPRAYGV